MVTEDAGFFEYDEPQFDLGFSIDPSEKVGSELEQVVDSVNYLQDRVDTGARAQVARIQTTQNLLSNKIRRSIDELIQPPAAAISDLQQNLVVDVTGKVAQAGEGVNRILSSIAGDDDKFTRCLIACRREYSECLERSREGDIKRGECVALFGQCLRNCRAQTFPDRPEPPGVPPPIIPPPETKPPARPPGELVSPPPGQEDWIGGFPDIPPPPDIQPGVPGDVSQLPSDCWLDTAHPLILEWPYVHIDGQDAPIITPGNRPAWPPPKGSPGWTGVSWSQWPWATHWELGRPANAVLVVIKDPPGSEARPFVDPDVIEVPGYDGPFRKWWMIPACQRVQGIPQPPSDVPPAPEAEEPTFCIPICPPRPTEEECPTGITALFLDCATKELYWVNIQEGEEPELRNEGDIEIPPSTPMTQEALQGYIDLCGVPEEDEEEPEDQPPPYDRPTTIGTTIVDTCPWLPDASVLAASGIAVNPLCYYLGIQNPDGSTRGQIPGATLTDNPLGVLSNVVGQWLNDMCKHLGVIVPALTPTSPDCTVDTQFAIAISRIFYNIVALLTGPTFENREVLLKQQTDYCLPVRIPPVDAAIEGYLADNIDEAALECWVRGNNYVYPYYKSLVKARRSKLGIQELVSLLARDKINVPEYTKRIRELGFLNEAEGEELWELSRWIPGPQDLIRWMVRDVEDEDIVTRFELDTDFSEKFTGQVEEYSEYQRVSREDMLRFWREHWIIPGAHQLYEMYHRLRYEDTPEGVKTTVEDIKTALKQQDVAPFWVDRQIAVSFHPLTRVDVRRAFRIGKINRPQVVRAYNELGYSDANAEILASFAESLVDNHWLKSPWIKKRADNLVTAAEFNNVLTEEGAKPDHLVMAENRADLLRKMDMREQCYKAYRRRFLDGDLNVAGAEARVNALVNDPPATTIMVEGWACELAAQDKAVPASKLCEWWQAGIIDAGEFRDRLSNIGYDEDDVLNIMANCQRKLNIRLEREEKARIKQQAAESKRQAREIERQRKQADSDVKRREKAAEKARKVRQRKEDLLVESAKRLSNRLEQDIVLTMRTVKTTFSQMKSLHQWSEADILQAVVQASQLKHLESLDAYPGEVSGILNELPVPDIGGNGSD